MNNRRRMTGVVTSDKMDKTVVVKVESWKRHRLYHKVVKHVKKYKAHDADNACQIGDIVQMIESRPLSREKRWVVTDILERA